MKTRLASSLVLLTTAVVACIRITAALAQEAEDGAEAVVPPGQEELLAEMLGKGATLPDGCKLAEGHVEHVKVEARYACPAGDVVFELVHPSRAGGGVTRTDRFALTLRSGSPPESLAPVLVSLIRARESAFEWKWVRPTSGESSSMLRSVFAAPGSALARINRVLLAGSFVLLVVGAAYVVGREVKARRPPPRAVLALLLIWAAGLALRLLLSPRTFLHEYYHIAETLSDYLAGDSRAIYGDTGPALFQFVGAALGRPDDVQVIFVTNAVLASMAIPAVALVDMALVGSWARSLSAAVLLCVLPQHLRFSASEILFVQAVTFGMAALALFVLYVRTRRLEDALCAALALSLAVQTRPEMLFFPAVPLALVLLAEPRSWRVLIERRTLLALSVAGLLLVPRLIELVQVLGRGGSPTPNLRDLHGYWNSVVLFHEDVTPPVYWLLLIVGLPFGLRRKPGLVVWAILVFAGYTVFSLSLYNNGPYNVRTQLLPVSFVVFIAAGAASAWMALWGRHRRAAIASGAFVLVTLAAIVVVRSHGFVTELRDQQLEWSFLERTVPLLPDQATLLTAVENGGRDLDAFPQFLLQREKKTYQMVDVRHAASGEAAWPPPAEDLLYYRGMFCYFAFPDQPPPDPMTAPCRAVDERYMAEPLFVEDLDTRGFSALHYARGPFRIGFFRLRALR